jgi:LysR family transcriptional regulator, hydrogen peroxide-inducible genes activator
MNIRDLKYLVAVAQCRHFGHAAEMCHVSQPTLSTQLKKLEETLDVVLVERSNRQVVLSAVGEKIVEQARRVLREVDELTRIAEQHRDPFGGDLRLGMIPTVAPYLLPCVLGPIRKRFPKLRIALNEGQTADIWARLKLGELDAIILALPLVDDQTEIRTLYREPFLFTVSGQHPFASRKHVVLKELANEQMLLLEDGHCLRDQALSICDSMGAVENTNFRATSLETLRQMVRANVGTTLMPQLAVTRTSGVRYIPFQKSGREPAPHREIGLCWRKASSRGGLLDEMTTLLRAAVGEVLDQAVADR